MPEVRSALFKSYGWSFEPNQVASLAKSLHLKPLFQFRGNCCERRLSLRIPERDSWWIHIFATVNHSRFGVCSTIYFYKYQGRSANAR